MWIIVVQSCFLSKFFVVRYAGWRWYFFLIEVGVPSSVEIWYVRESLLDSSCVQPYTGYEISKTVWTAIAVVTQRVSHHVVRRYWVQRFTHWRCSLEPSFVVSSYLRQLILFLWWHDVVHCFSFRTRFQRVATYECLHALRGHWDFRTSLQSSCCPLSFVLASLKKELLFHLPLPLYSNNKNNN